MFNLLINIFIFLGIISFSLGQLGRISFSNQEVNVYFYEILMVFALVIMVGRYRIKPIMAVIVKSKIIVFTIILFIFSYIISLYQYSLYQNIVAVLYFLRFLFYLSYFTYVSHHIENIKETKKYMKWGLIGYFVVLIVSSIVQYIWYPDLRNLDYLGWDSHYHRMFGLFFDTSIAAAIYGAAFFYLIQSKNVLLKNNGIRIGIQCLIAVFLILTFSRSAYIAFIISLGVLLFQKRKKLFLVACLLGFAAFIYFIPKQFGSGVGLLRTFSVNARLKDYRNGLMIWSKFPLFGIGYNHLRYARERYSVIESAVDQTTSSHAGASLSSSYLIILICGGITGFIMFLLTAKSFVQTNPYLTYVFLYIGIISFADNIFLHPFILFLIGSMYTSIVSYLSGKRQ